MRKKADQIAEAVSTADMRAADTIGSYRDKLPVRAWSLVAKLGDQPELRLISGGVILSGLLLGRGRLFRAGIRMLLAHEVATSAKDMIKKRIDRTRPHSASDRRQAKPSPGRKTAKKHTSFPSGHSAGAVAMAQAFAREFPQHRAPALAAAGVVAIGQIPKRAHYPTDVAAGVVLGVAAEALVAAVIETADRALRPEEETPIRSQTG